jgi:lysophospholipase L1-like esterase
LSGIALGDSTVAAYAGGDAVMSFITTSINKESMAVPGQTIAQQTAVYAASSYGYNSKWSVIQVGLNDLDPAEAASVAIARLQSLVDAVRARSPASAKVLIAKMTPCRARLITVYGGVNGPIAYQKWLDMNEAITGGGATPITNVDARISAHEPLLNDGSGNLAAPYDTGDNIHENNAGRIIIAQAWTDALTTLGVL